MHLKSQLDVLSSHSFFVLTNDFVKLLSILIDAELDVVTERRHDCRLQPELCRRVVELGDVRMTDCFFGRDPIFRRDSEQPTD